MSYQQHDLIQGSAEWLQFRASSYGASDAAAMLGLSKYKTRAQLLREKATGITSEVDEQTQARFDRGHAIEAFARPLADALTGEEFYPAVLSREVDGLPLSASLDGILMDDSNTWECKTSNMVLREALERAEIPAEYEPQLEQGLLISGAGSCLFTISDGTAEGTMHARYVSKPKLRAAIIAGWHQFSTDLANYTPATPTPVVLAAPVESLPAVAVRLDGKIAVIDNLDVFGERLRAFVERIDKEPSTDQAFADCEEAVKVLKRAEDALEAAEANALAQIDPVEAMRRTVADLNNLARSTRLLIEKVVKQRKEQLRAQVAADALTAYRAHLTQINATLSVSVLESLAFTGDVAGAIKGKRSLDNLRADVAQVVANYKITASTEGNRHHANIAVLAHAGRAELFRDRDALVRGKQPEDLANLVQARIADADKAEQVRLDAERAKIRQEEEARAQRDAEALAEQERQRIRKEEQDKAQAEQQAAWDAQRAADHERRHHDEEAQSARSAGGWARGPQRAGPDPTPPQPASNDPSPKAPETPAAVAVLDEAQQSPVAAARPGATIKLGDINARIAPLSITGDGLALLGFKPVGTEKSAKLYSEADFHDICRAMGRVLKAAMEAPALEKAA